MSNIGRSFRTIIILLVVIIALTVTVGQIFKKVVNYEDTVAAVVFSRDLKKGELIKAGEAGLVMSTVTVPRMALPPSAITTTDTNGDMYISEDVYKGEYVVAHALTAEYPFQISYDIPSGYSLVSVKFDRADGANAWNVFEGQEVSLIYTPSISMAGEDTTYLSERTVSGKIYSIKDAQFFVQGEQEYNPTKLLYITFLVKENDAVFITHAKDKGRIDIIQ